MISPTFDLAQYPTGDTIRLLASLLERMTNANDQLNKANITRKGTTEMRRSSSASPLGACPSSSPLPKPSSTTAATTISSASSINNIDGNRNKNTGGNYTVFHARSIPSIDLYSYLSRILKYCPCANECFLSLLVYFDRMSKNALAITGQPFTIDSFNIHRLIISGVMVSSKFFSDIFYTNTRYAKVGGLPVSELNRLELEFLQLNEFNISVSISELQRYGDQLLKVGLMEQEMRMLRESSPSPYTVRHGRSTSLGSTALVRTLDGIENYKQQQHHHHHQQQQQQQQHQQQQHRSMDQPSVQQLVDGTNKLYLDEHHHYSSNNSGNTTENVKRHSASCIGKQQHNHQYHQYHPHQQGNKEMYMQYQPMVIPQCVEWVA
ncbi:cyclin-domain-containing protein [Absidia repens]|uniref:Cyclin-domain-containing protein n=1 Tax=Absidia repens TaxID=90262 RepID=A0A1X2ILV4_9FUNG|nr:cyclin-domain-containing protein [Absidia repens]